MSCIFKVLPLHTAYRKPVPKPGSLPMLRRLAAGESDFAHWRCRLACPGSSVPSPTGIHLLFTPTDSISLTASSLTASRRSPDHSTVRLPSNSAVVVRQRNSDPEALVRFLQEQEVSITYLALDDLRSHLGIIFRAFSSTTSLSVLLLSGIQMQAEEAECLAGLLAVSGSLHRLKIQQCSICPQGLTHLAVGVAASNIKELQIVKSCISATCMGTLFTPLDSSYHSNSQRLQENLENGQRLLDLDCNPLGAAGAIVLARSLQGLDSNMWCRLSSLRLGYAKLEADGATSICAALRGYSTLRSLSLPGNNFGVAGAFELAEMLKHNEALRGVWLHNNNFKDHGMAYFVDCIGSLYLDCLDLRYNQVSPATSKAFDAAIDQCTRTLSTFQPGALSDGVRAVPFLSDENGCTGATMTATLEHYYKINVRSECLAFAMGQHERLGVASPVLLLDEALVFLILRLCWRNPHQMRIMW